MKLEVGKAAPLFSLLSDEGEISLSDLKGKNVVLYFYPKDDTPGCTIEAQDFTKKNAEFEKLNCVILGISKDDVESHCKFINKYKLNFNLLADSDGEVCEKYGVIKEKSMFGKKYFGIDRSTFLIDKLGKISHIWRSVKVNGHVEEVLASLKGKA
ncbi:MAG: thioredoxin-dependent thiol peroxidase [Rickettsiales bacterium]|nr:thioredoxin-dependent thiol peroxidase [Rickettsiales bacterium]